MFSEIAHQAQEKAAQTAQAALLGLGASLMLVVGLGFLTTACWIFLAAATSSLTAAAAIGAAYCGVGLILFAVLSGRQKAHVRSRKRAAAASSQTKPTQELVHEIVLAFVTGMQAGQKSRRG